jgi:hypothetical protein
MIYRGRFLAFVGGALLALSFGTGCASIAGEQSAETKFLVKPKADATFFGWSEITVEQEASSVNRATLVAVTVEATEPAEIKDMGFIDNVTGEAVTSTERTVLVQKTSMPPGERVVPLDLVYQDDLRGFFEDGHTIRIEWNGRTSASFTAWPPDGIWIRVNVVVELE